MQMRHLGEGLVQGERVKDQASNPLFLSLLVLPKSLRFILKATRMMTGFKAGN